MPARVVPPSASLWSAAQGPGEQPLDLEAEIRRAAVLALQGAGPEEADALSQDALDTLACTACEAIQRGHPTGLQAALDPVLEEVGLAEGPAREGVLAALLAIAVREATEEGDPATLLAALSKPPLGKKAAFAAEKPRWQRRGDAEKDRAMSYLLERNLQVQREHEELKARELELAAYYGGNAVADVGFTAPEASGVAGGSCASTCVPKMEGSGSESSEDDEVTKQDREITKRRLRQLGQPVTLFGETDDCRTSRLRRCEMTTDQDDFAGGSTNVMQILDRRAEREAPLAVQRETPAVAAALQARLAAPVVGRRGLRPPAGPGTAQVTVPLAPETRRQDGSESEGDMEAEPVVPADTVDDPPDPGDGDEVDDDTRSVVVWLRTVLREWEAVLQGRQKEEFASTAFNTEKAQFRQSKQYLRPLRRALRDGDISPGIVSSLAEVARHCRERRYKEAKEAYMRLAIGNSPWPMGVTFVTFHDRANRHKIAEDNVAHVLDDETTRKYVQMIKRLCTFCEARWPIDPSFAA